MWSAKKIGASILCATLMQVCIGSVHGEDYHCIHDGKFLNNCILILTNVLICWTDTLFCILDTTWTSFEEATQILVSSRIQTVEDAYYVATGIRDNDSLTSRTGISSNALKIIFERCCTLASEVLSSRSGYSIRQLYHALTTSELIPECSTEVQWK